MMVIRRMQKADTKGGFCCGRPALDDYFARRAWSHDQANVARVYVLAAQSPSGKGAGEIVGFYTLASKELARERLRSSLPGQKPKYPLPVTYIGYLAVREDFQGRGLGRSLMKDALEQAVKAAEIVGSVGVFLDSLDNKSTAFYRRLGFVDIPRDANAPANGPQPMFLPMKTLLDAARPTSL